MNIKTFENGDSIIHSLDPRFRLVVAAALAVLLAMSQSWLVLCLGIVAALIFILMAKIPLGYMSRRLFGVNCFVLMLFLFLPLGSGGRSLFSVLGLIDYGTDGVVLAGKVALKSNAIVIMVTSLVMTMDSVILGHALNHLYVPSKLAHMFLFSVRYIDVIHCEYLRMRDAMRIRAFRPGVNFHTYRTLAGFAAMLLIRSLNRSERVMQALLIH